MEAIVECGLGRSRLYEAISSVPKGLRSGVSAEQSIRAVHAAYDEHIAHEWCHTISNAMIIAAALLYGAEAPSCKERLVGTFGFRLTPGLKTNIVKEGKPNLSEIRR